MLAIDFGSHSIKAVKLERTRNGFFLENFGIVLSPPDSIAHGEIKDAGAASLALDKMLHKKRISDRNCIIALTGQKVIVREVTTPLMNEKELKEGIKWEAPKYVPYDLNDSLLDAKIIEEFQEKDGTKMMKVLLVATPRNLVEQQIAVLKNIKLQPRVVDIVANAQIRAFENYLTPISSLSEDGTLIDIILSIGASTTEITLLEGDRLKFTRTILKGGDDVNRLLENKLNIPFQEAELLKRQIGIFFDGKENISEENLEITKGTKGDKGIKIPKIIENSEIIEPSLSSEQKQEKQIDPNTTISQSSASLSDTEKVAELIEAGVTDIFNEIRKSLNYFKTQYQKVNFQRIILCGGMSKLPNLGQLLKKQFGITVVIANPFKDIDINSHKLNIENLEKYKSVLSTAIGLAKRER